VLDNFEWSWKVESRITFWVTVVVAAAFLMITLDSVQSLLLAVTNDYFSNPVAMTEWKGVSLPTRLTFWPYHFMMFNAAKIGVQFQLINFAIALATIVTFYRLLQIWFDSHYAAIASLMFASSSMLIGLASTGSPQFLMSLYFALVLLAITNVYRGRTSGFLIIAITLPLSFYLDYHGLILGLVQLLVIAYTLKARRLSRPSRNLTIGTLFLSSLILLPFIWLYITYPQTIVNPISFDPLENLKNGSLLLVHGHETNPLSWPATWPLLDIASAAIIALGLLTSIKRRKAVRYQISLILFVLVIVNLSIFGTSVASLCFVILPFYVLFASGLRYLNESWKSVFPKNNAADLISNSVVVGLFAVVTIYHLTRFTTLLPQLLQ
jgi:hypothetical protein